MELYLKVETETNILAILSISPYKKNVNRYLKFHLKKQNQKRLGSIYYVLRTEPGNNMEKVPVLTELGLALQRYVIFS